MITLCCVDRLQTNFRHQKRVSALELMISYMWSYFYRVHFYWVIFSLLNTIIEGNFEVIKTVNLLYQNGSLSKDIKLLLICIYNRAFDIQGRELLVWMIKIKCVPYIIKTDLKVRHPVYPLHLFPLLTILTGKNLIQYEKLLK